ncbi:hypothetical protein GCM10009613_25480 [Pseudonocardia kongjuensis]|uniref:Ribosomal RNA adenine methylase transferase N-terminal domain-containing protein n=1 Tax=Pseudonocardia kongjuensis TaxID=102227 RepID=A0ABP4IIK2_9PSEU
MPVGTIPGRRRDVGGRHELGQNFLVDRRVVDHLVGYVPCDPLPVVELGPGDGVITDRLVADRPKKVTVVEIDPRRAERLRGRFRNRVRVVRGDMLSYRLDEPHHVVSNVPFGITTPLLRHLLGQRTWRSAALLLQWEVARKRAAIGGTTLLTASWWPWYDFALGGRVPSAAFRPRPSVDGGILLLARRPTALVPPGERAAYQRLVTAAFRGHRLVHAVRDVVPAARRWAANEDLPSTVRARDLTAQQWVSLHRAAAPRPRRSARSRR